MFGISRVNKHSNNARMEKIVEDLSQDKSDNKETARILQDNSAQLLQIITDINRFKSADVKDLDIAHFLMGLKSLEDLGFEEGKSEDNSKHGFIRSGLLEKDHRSKLFSSDKTFMKKELANVLKNDILRSNIRTQKFTQYLKFLMEDEEKTGKKLRLLLEYLEGNKQLGIVNADNDDKKSVDTTSKPNIHDDVENKYTEAVSGKTSTERISLLYEIMKDINKKIVAAHSDSNHERVAQHLQKLAEFCEKVAPKEPMIQVDKELAILCYAIAYDASNKLSQL
ncbi:MAG: hypothetical protein KBD37_08885 [Burkholderiales bacterium]|nr:hypothetical protein [Burkholderiales bacterium]